ncbi:glycine betaine/L-proline ABC transporter substrate-binding protein ProX [Burkholderia sp. Ac-20379]|uniref:glycine betaine/L-proline ABC transporter substrate-binding protein ProX n=1 Tax=Burkholderia sp. Ac-20379 TaxID=2703900 RepID=UPI0019813613|nr:glycine betaine/L-proline ABC transporter substrate-binding protein ProX [Burkholderia sp. Ac-20379]MBN3729211.1 glycine betaine/L-proline ABC transporter substrate-binding protein ProX [Burkholderia sp. Ac-20379]
MKMLKPALAALACAAMLSAAAPAPAAGLPGAGKTIHYAQTDGLGANYVSVQIAIRALKAMGYEVVLKTMGTVLFFQAVAQGDVDLETDVNFPQSDPNFRAVQDRAMRVGNGQIDGGGINGYLIDRKTALAHNITSLEQMKDPKIAALFGGDGKAQLISCDPGWSCGDVVNYQLDKFGLRQTVKPVTGKYEALMADVVSRIKAGEPAFFYAWSPSWTTSELVPGKDVVWLPTPADALPPNVPNAGSALVKDVPGCAGGANPCRMAMASWNYGAVANKAFIAANPPVRALVEQIHFPSSTWSNWELAISQAHGASSIVDTLADQWIAANKATFERWVAAASNAR